MFHIDGMTIRDEFNRERIFRGINACFKMVNFDLKKINKKFIDSYFDSMSSFGVNLIRLGFTWSMLEPVEKQFDENAFNYLKYLIEKCKRNSIYVVLDMHQDLFYSNKGIGDGAPRWVTTAYKQKRPVFIWAEGYFYMKDTQRAFSDFWNNKNDFQEKYVAVWKKVTQELGGYENVIAYDYFNEPLVSANSNKIFFTLINNALKVGLNIDFDAEKHFANGKEKIGFVKMSFAIFTKIKTAKNLKKFLNNLDDYNAFEKVVKPCEKYVEGFDNNYYQPFIDKMVDSCGDDNHFNLFEHSYHSNMGLPFEIKLGKNYIYSPHAYDVFIDSPLYNSYSSNQRIKYILDHIKQNQIKMNVPVIMGEWGGSSKSGNDWIKHIDYIYNVFEENHWSNIYWSFRYDNQELVKVMNRPYPAAVCGDIISYKTDNKTRTFVLEYSCHENNAKTEVYVNGKGIVEFDNKIGYNKIELSY